MAHYLREQSIGRQIVLGDDARRPAARGQDELNQRLLEYHPYTVQELHASRLCAYCGAHYTEQQNVGQWQCYYHPGRAMPDRRVRTWEPRDRWTCCNRIDDAPGCAACDHSETRAWDHGRKVVVAVPEFLLATGQVAAPRADARLAQPDSTWVVGEIRHSLDVRKDAQDEHRYQTRVLGPQPAYVMRMHHYRRGPADNY